MELYIKKGKSQDWQSVDGVTVSSIEDLELTLSLGNGDIFNKIGIPYEAFESARFEGNGHYLIVHMNKSWRLDFVIS